MSKIIPKGEIRALRTLHSSQYETYELEFCKAQRDSSDREAKAEKEEALMQERKEIGVELEIWMDEASPYRRIAQAEHAIIKLKRGEALKQKEA